MKKSTEKSTGIITRYGPIEDVMDRWARWRTYRVSGELGYPRKTILGKLRDGMPGAKCPCCLGAKRIEVGRIGNAVQYATCPQCSGQGEVKTSGSVHKINPYFIRPTAGFVESEDPISQRIDWLICTYITEDERVVVMVEYTQYGNRNYKLKKMKEKRILGVNHSSYNSLLESAQGKIADGLKAGY